MQSDQTQEQKCRHTGCACSVPKGEAYCSEHCRQASEGGSAAEGTLHRCGCGHADCLIVRDPPGQGAA